MNKLQEIEKNNRIVLHFFFFILIFSPLAFGTVELWSLTIMETAVFIAGILLLFMYRKSSKVSFYQVPGIIPLVFLLAYIAVQIIPFPPVIVKAISPETYEIYHETVLLSNPDAWVSFSLNRKAAVTEFFRIASYVYFYALTVQLLTRREDLKKTILVVVVFASFFAFLGILQHLLSNNKIFWFRELTQGGTPFGPYVNRNHYAGFMGMLFPLVLSLFLYYKPHVTYRSFREKITNIFNLQKTNIYILLGLSSVLIATSIFLTLSRSGIVSLCLSMICFGLIFFVRGAERKRGLIITVICILVVLSVGWFGWDPIIERFERIRSTQGDISDLRIEIWKDSKNIIRDFLISGTGFGSFMNIYPKYRTIMVDGLVDHAHNDYIELLSDGGIISFFLCSWFLLAIFYKSYRVFLRRREVYSIYIFIGSITGVISILIHSFTDFNLHIGSNGLYFFFLSGLAVSAANTRLREGLNDTYLKKIIMSWKICVAPIFAILIFSLLFNAGQITGKLYFNTIKDKILNEIRSTDDLYSIKNKANRASFFDPLESRYHYAMANTEKILSNNETALDHYWKSVRLNPLNSEYLQRLGLVLSEFEQYDNAEILLKTGIKHDVRNKERYKRYALWLFARGKTEAGLENMKTAITLEPKKTRKYITLMILSGLNDEEIRWALPEKVEPYLFFADYLNKTGKESMAEETYIKALHYLKNEERIKTAYFYEPYRFFMNKGKYEEALKIMKQGCGFFKDNAGMGLAVAGLYEKLGRKENAVKEYKNVLSIDPQNKGAKRRLENLLEKAE